MGTVFSYILLAVVAALVLFSLYLLVRILQIYLHARKLDRMRNYETMLYAALQKLDPQRTMETLLPDPDRRALEEVLLRMGDEGAEGWKNKVAELYELNGFSGKRLAQLDSRRKAKRIDAARRLGRVCDPKAVPKLKELLFDQREEVREAALYALGRIGNREALETMIEALDRGDRWTQEKISEAVEDTGDESREVLAELLEDENPLRRRFAAEVIVKVAGPGEIALLEKALSDEVVDVRARAADSLGKLRHHESRRALIGALGDPAWEVRAQAVKSLGRIGDEEDASIIAHCLRDGEWWVRNNAASALRDMGEAGEGPLEEALWDGDPFAREMAAQALEESSIVERIVRDMMEGEADPAAPSVLHRLAEIGSIAAITQAFTDLTDEDIKEQLKSLLSDIPNPDLQKVIAGNSGDSAVSRGRGGGGESGKGGRRARSKEGKERGL